MKKIIKSSALLFGICFVAGKAEAQLASDAPALTTQKVIMLQKERTAPAATAKTTATVQTASSSATVKAPAVTTAKPAETVEVAKPASSATPAVLPVVPMQTDKTQPAEKPKTGGN